MFTEAELDLIRKMIQYASDNGVLDDFNDDEFHAFHTLKDKLKLDE
jgi:hypothetical protein